MRERREDAAWAREAARAASRHRGPGWKEPVLGISVAAEMAGMHPQTLRQYDRIGLVVPQRQGGRQRRYSRADVESLRTVQALSREGVSLEGIRRIVELEREVERLQDTVAELAGQVDRLHHASRLARVFTVGVGGDVSARYDETARRAEPTTGTAGQRGRIVRSLPRGLTPKVLVWNPRRD